MLRENYYKYPPQLPRLSGLNDSVPAAPEGIKVERLDDELHLTWQKPVSEKQDLTYTVYYSLTDSIDTASAKSILATNIYGNELFLPIDVESERGYTFSVTASTRYRMESEPSPDTYYYLSKFIK